VSGNPAHRVTLTQKTFLVSFVETRRQHLDGDASPKRRLVAAVNNARAASADFGGVRESGGYQLSNDPARPWGRGGLRAFSGHIADRPPL
jgi:hypothetical protein